MPTPAVAQTVFNNGNTCTMAAYTSGSRLLAANYGRGSGHASRSGWTHLGDLNANGYADQLCMLWKASAGESTSLVFSGSLGSGGNILAITEITNVGDPIQSATGGNATSTGNMSLTITGTAAGSMLYAAFLGAAADAWAGGHWTPSSGWTENVDGADAGHPFAWGGYQLSGSGGSFTAQPVHGFDWTGWSPRGEDARIVEFPAAGGGGGGGGPTARVINMAKKLIVPERERLWAPGLATV